MLQIKTIRNRLDNAESFDKAVNAALAEGWVLIKREVIIPRAQSENMQTHTMLYAELERVVITEAERCCENCAHGDADPNSEPCRSCNDGTLEGWEPAEGVLT